MARFGRGNWGLKLLSLLMAVVLWVYVSNDQNPTKEQEFKSIPVEVRGVGSNLAVADMPGNVSVQVQANQNVLAEFDPRSIQAYIDLTSAKAGKIAVPVQVKVPPGVKVVSLRPQQVTVKLEPLGEKQVPLKPHYLNDLRLGYKVFDLKTRPDEVILRGPKSVLDRVEYASVDIDLKNRDRSFGATLPVTVTDNAGNFLEEGLVSKNPPAAEVLVTVVQEAPTKTVPVYPQITGTPAKGYAVTMTVVDPVDLVITGTADLLNGISSVFTQPIDINEADKDVYLEVGPVLPHGVTANRQSLKILVKISREKTVTGD